MRMTPRRFAGTISAIFFTTLSSAAFAQATTEPPFPDAPPEAAAKTEEKGGVEVGYDKGKGTKIETTDGQFELRINLRNQFRFETSRPTTSGAEFSSRVVIARTRFQLEGHVFGGDNKYKFEFGYDRGTFGFVKDGWFEKSLGGVNLRVGQWKRPFNRQEIVSDFAQEFPERANTADFVGGGRDIGIAIHNGYEGSPDGLEWVLGVFDRFSGGSDRPIIPANCVAVQDPVTMQVTVTCVNGPASTNVSDWGPTIVARAGFNMGGIKGYSEADLEGGPLRLAIGVSYKVDLGDLSKADDTSTPAVESSIGDNLQHGVQGDVLLKVAGLDVFAGAYLMKIKTADAKFGFTGQAGYFVAPKKAQVAGRFSLIPVGDAKQLEIRGAFNWYFVGHYFKWSTDAGIVKLTKDNALTPVDDTKPEFQLRSTAQVTF